MNNISPKKPADMRESDYSLYVEQRKLADMITRHAELDDVRITLASGARANQAVVQGLHPLHYAVYEQYYDCVKVLYLWRSIDFLIFYCTCQYILLLTFDKTIKIKSEKIVFLMQDWVLTLESDKFSCFSLFALVKSIICFRCSWPEEQIQMLLVRMQSENDRSKVALWMNIIWFKSKLKFAVWKV